MRSLLMMCLLFLAGCSGCVHFTKPTCEAMVEDFAKSKEGWVALPPVIGETFGVFALVNPETADMEGRVFLLPEDPGYRKEDLKKEIPNGSDEGYCKDGDQDIRVLGFKEKLDPNAGLTET